MPRGPQGRQEVARSVRAGSGYARAKYIEAPPTPESIASIEAELGVKLPATYVELMQTQNGGIPRNCCFPTDVPTSWAEFE